MGPLFGGKRSIFDTVVQFFKEDDWKYRQLEGKTILATGFQGENGRWQCYAQAREDQKQFVFYSTLDARTPPEKRHLVAEFLTRANYGLPVGNFEMDYSDGEVRFKTSIDVEGNEETLTTGLIKQLVYINVLITDRYFPGVMSVIYGDVSPADAIEKIEGQT